MEQMKNPRTTRRFVPLSLNEGVIAQMQVLRVNGSRVKTNVGHVIIANISPRELRFLTNLQLKSDVEWHIWLRFMLEDVELELTGRIRSGNEDQNRWWRYEVRLDLDDGMQTKLIGVLNRRLLRLYPEKLRQHQLYILQSFLKGGH